MLKDLIKAIEDFNNELTYGKDVNKEQVESFLGVVALLYVTANADNSIDREELQVITLYKYNMTRSLERPGREELRDLFYTYLEELEKIEQNKRTLRLSDALKYLPSELSKDMKTILKTMVTEVIDVDGKVTDEEKQLKKNLCLYIEKGQSSIAEIKKLEVNS